MAWVWILLAGVFEIGFATSLVATQGLTRLWPVLLTGVFMVASLAAMSQALRDLPMGTAYAVWTGIGAAGTALIGVWFFGEPASIARFASIGLIVAGIAGLKLFG